MTARNFSNLNVSFNFDELHSFDNCLVSAVFICQNVFQLLHEIRLAAQICF